MEGVVERSSELSESVVGPTCQHVLFATSSSVLGLTKRSANAATILNSFTISSQEAKAPAFCISNLRHFTACLIGIQAQLAALHAVCYCRSCDGAASASLQMYIRAYASSRAPAATDTPKRQPFWPQCQDNTI